MFFETDDEYDCRNGGSNCRRRALLRADHDDGVEPWKRELGSQRISHRNLNGSVTENPTGSVTETPTLADTETYSFFQKCYAARGTEG